jgi:hypothetical protein
VLQVVSRNTRATCKTTGAAPEWKKKVRALTGM